MMVETGLFKGHNYEAKTKKEDRLELERMADLCWSNTDIFKGHNCKAKTKKEDRGGVVEA